MNTVVEQINVIIAKEGSFARIYWKTMILHKKCQMIFLYIVQEKKKFLHC